MGFFRRLFRIGATAATAVAAVKVAEKYKENNPNGVQDSNGDGKADLGDVLREVGKAAGEVAQDAANALSGAGKKAEDAEVQPQSEEPAADPQKA